MRKYVLTKSAEQDAWLIWDYLAKNAGLKVADQIKADFIQTFRMLADVPGIGHPRDDLTEREVFFFTINRYMVIYRKTNPLEILAIIHGSRDIPSILEKRDL